MHGNDVHETLCLNCEMHGPRSKAHSDIEFNLRRYTNVYLRKKLTHGYDVLESLNLNCEIYDLLG